MPVLTETLPVSIQRVIRLAVEQVEPSWIRLFGSHARGDAGAGSDYDLAFDFPPEKQSAWNRFCLDVAEGEVTLRAVDLVNMREASPELQERILDEGLVLYEKDPALS